MSLIAAMAAQELVCLWSDLVEVRRRGIGSARDAGPGAWSIECDNLWERISLFTYVVGPVDAGNVPAIVHHLLDRVPEPDPDALARLVAR